VILVAATALAGTFAFAPRASAEGLFDFFFGGSQKQQQQQQAPPQASFFADPFGLNQQPATPPRPVASVSGPAFCVRSCDGRYFPLMRSNASPVAICQAFCPASATKVFYGSSIDGATSATGERYADSENAFAYRKALRAGCTCNGRDPAGLAPVIATANGLVAYSGVKTANGQTAEFTPVAAYPGLTAEVRARLGEMKVAPVSAEMIAGDTPAAEAKIDAVPLAAPAPKTRPRDKRAEAN
jgi:hypothetical protein